MTLTTRVFNVGRRLFDRWSAHLREREDQVFLVLTLIIGALVGLVVVAFIVLTERLGARLYPADGAAWRRVLIPVIGSLGMGYLLYRFFPNARGSGVPQTKAALFVEKGRITARTTLGKFLCTSATLASGIPLGREGPSVQVGAGIASILGRRLGLRTEKVQALIPVASAAAIAAAFNTPLAAVVFALEEIMGDLHARVLGSVVLASAASWMVLRLLLGNNPLFQAPQYQLVHPLEFAIYALLGVVGGVVSAAFTRLLLTLREKFLHAPSWLQPIQPVAGGLLVGVLGWFVPEVLGVGYAHVGSALNGQLAFRLMAMLVLFKLLTVTLSYASGNAGGIFGPSLFIGAMLGGAIGHVAHSVLPAYTATSGAYALVGMGAAFAGIVRAPMTSVLMIFETTRDYSVIVPLMIANLLSFFVSSRLQRLPIYEALARQDGIHLPAAESRDTSGGPKVAAAMRKDPPSLPASATVASALETARDKDLNTWLVTDAQGLVGVVGVKVLEKELAEGHGASRVEAFVSRSQFPHVHADQSIYLALERMRALELDALPVVHRGNIHRVEGLITLEDILRRYAGPRAH